MNDPSVLPEPSAPPSSASARLLERVAQLRRPMPDVGEVLKRAWEAPDQGHHAWAAVRVHNEGWLLPLSDLAATAIPGQWAAWPHMPAFVRGIINVRGQVYTVLDMQEILYQTPAPPVQEGWLTALSGQRAEGLALWWQEWVGLKDPQAFTLTQEQHPGAHKVWRDAEGQSWFEWRAADWLAQQEWTGALARDEAPPLSLSSSVE